MGLLQRLAQQTAPDLIVGLVRLSRVQVTDAHHLQALQRIGRPFLFAVWHGRMLAPIVHHRDQGVVAMVSRHGDGEIAARALQSLGYRTVRGSSTEGGREAFHLMLDRLRDGACGAIVPDGPLGPSRKSKPGIVRLASRAGGLPILPVGCAARPASRLGSWDRFMVPWPLSRIVVAYGQPLSVPAEVDDEQLEPLRDELDRRLDAADRRAEQVVGWKHEPGS
jgi:lysophospholipid acyltransferase (LPLAT)-like uncharacterized protein